MSCHRRNCGALMRPLFSINEKRNEIAKKEQNYALHRSVAHYLFTVEAIYRSN